MPTLKQKMQKLTGYCSHCGTEIIDLTKRKRARMLPNYREHEIQLSDGSLMRVGVCDTCKAKLVAGPDVQKTADKIVANHKIYWDANPKLAPGRKAAYKDLTVIDPNTNLQKVMIKRKQMRDEEKLQRQIDDERREKDRAKEEKKMYAEKEKEEKRLEKLAKEREENELKEKEKAQKEKEKIEKEQRPDQKISK